MLFRSLTDYHLLICPSNGDGTIDWQSGVGTAGFTLVEYEPGVRTLTKANPNYWKLVSRFIVHRLTSDPSAELLMVEIRMEM